MSQAARVVMSTMFALGAGFAALAFAALTGGYVKGVIAVWSSTDSAPIMFGVGVAIGLLVGFLCRVCLDYLGAKERPIRIAQPMKAAFLCGGAVFFVARGLFAMVAGVVGANWVVGAACLAVATFVIAAAFIQWFTTPRGGTGV